MTILALATFILLLYFCGLGPVLLLFPSKDSTERVAIMPAIGLCAHIVLSIFLAQFSLSGNTIAIISIPFFGLLTVFGCRRNRISLNELASASPGVFLGLFSVVMIGWPLLHSGIHNYWGFANSDEGFLIPVLEWIQAHAMGLPPEYAAQFHHLGVFRDIPEATLLAVFYTICTLSWITRIPVGLLFNLTALGLVYVVPGSVYALARALDLPRRVCLTATVLVACSSLVAYTFYLDSLGAVSVIALMPVVCVLTLRFLKQQDCRAGVPLAIVCAAMYYEYLGALGVMGVIVGAAFTYAVLTGSISLRRALTFGGLTGAFTAALFAPFAASTLGFFLVESFGTRRKAVEELQMSFALTLTEHGLPYSFGLWVPGATAWPFVLYPQTAIVVGSVFCLLLIIFCWHRGSGLPTVFRIILSALVGVLLFYAYRRIGYSVFKLVAWIHPLVLIVFVSAVFAVSDWLSRRGRRILSWVAFAALPLYVVPNLALSWEMGLTTAFPTTGMTLHNAPRITFQDMRELQLVGRKWTFASVIATLPDSVAAGWAKAFLLGTGVSFFPMTNLEVVDSWSRPSTPLPPGQFLLHWNRPDLDIVPLPKCPAIWSNATFALSRVAECRNTLVVGHGWYRAEYHVDDSSLTSRLRWLRKRGEFLLINPSPKPQRLKLAMVAGPGNRSDSRNVSVFLNGQRIDQFAMVGAAQMLTKPFVAPGPSSQLEILVDEDAQPMPRSGALWNYWVPGDARRLNIGVIAAALVDDNSEAGAIGTSFDVAPPNGDSRVFNGLFMDGWIGRRATVSLATPAPAPKELGVSGMAPGGAGLTFPLQITPFFDGVALPPCFVERAGWFRAHCAVPDEVGQSMRPGQIISVEIQSEKTFVGMGDPRQISIQLQHVELLPAAPSR